MASKKYELQNVLQTSDWDCGIACVKIILLRLGQIFDDTALFAILRALGVGESVWTIDLAYILHHFNIDCIYHTITCGVDPNYKDKAYYKADFNAEEIRVNTLFKNSSELDIKIIKTSLTMEDIFSKLDNGYIAVVLVDSIYLTCNNCQKEYQQSEENHTTDQISNYESSKQYAGHYIVLCGYDTGTGVVFYKNPSLEEIECCVNISLFDLARKSHGTDEDIIFINTLNTTKIKKSECKHARKSTFN